MKYVILFFGLVVVINFFGGVDKLVSFAKENVLLLIPLVAGYFLYLGIKSYSKPYYK